MKKQSAGILLYRIREEKLQVLLVHPGGPYWAKKDAGSWSIPKGEYGEGEEALATARREFEEELGSPPEGTFIPLQPIRQRGGKMVMAWACEGDLDATSAWSNTFEMEWPPRSGKMAVFPEVDRAEWFTLREAREKILEAQRPLLDALEQVVENRRTDQD